MGALPIIAAGVGLASTIANIDAEGKSAEAAAQSHFYNAQIGKYNANQAVLQAQEDERRLRQKTTQYIGQARANVGASGIASGGSPLDVLEMSAQNAELDALTVRHQGELKRWAYEQGANLDLSKGYLAEQGGRDAQLGAGLKGAASLLSFVPYGKNADEPKLKRS